ncbi:unnamed protein product, partial [Leptidea sinapis]
MFLLGYGSLDLSTNFRSCHFCQLVLFVDLKRWFSQDFPPHPMTRQCRRVTGRSIPLDSDDEELMDEDDYYLPPQPGRSIVIEETDSDDSEYDSDDEKFSSVTQETVYLDESLLLDDAPKYEEYIQRIERIQK